MDVGGTLWSERLWHSDHFASVRRARLREAGVPAWAVDPFFALVDAGARDESAEYLDIHAWLAGRLADVGLEGLATESIRRAWSIPAVEMVPVLPGAAEFLAGLRGSGLRCHVVSNAFVRTADEYWQDFCDQGLDRWIDSVVSSVDTLWRKPDRRIYQTALTRAAVPPESCVMIGNSEAKDVLPARDLAMKTVRVAIEEPRPADSAATVVCTSLAEALTAVVAMAAL